MLLSVISEGNEELFENLKKFVGFFPPLGQIVNDAVREILVGSATDFQLTNMFMKCWEHITSGADNKRDAAKGSKTPGIQLLDKIMLQYANLKVFYPVSYNENPRAIKVVGGGGSSKVKRIIRPGLINKAGQPRLMAVVECEPSRSVPLV